MDHLWSFRLSGADRKRRYRQRQRKQIRVYPTPTPDWIIETAINAGWLTEAESCDREKVGDLLAKIATEWGKRWRDYFGTRPAAAGSEPVTRVKPSEFHQ